ncbi:MAG: hypothetical protein EP330_11815 [Deltaproteobacteria bacterium]|nr:MAG: hypothetical protein EP330_11815 [Deltaproteobacteria bacterium]
MRILSLSALLLTGCAVRHTGFCYGTETGAELRLLDGKVERLVLAEDSAPLHFLEGHTTEIEGKKALGRIHVEDWRVHDGLHGLPVWVGPLVSHAGELGIQDRNSGVFYYLDPASARSLDPYFGDVVLLEGWVQDARRVKVAYFRVLADPEDPPS